jgi:predicted DNA-binding transcriptional regulator YafY
MVYIRDLCKSVYFHRPFASLRDLRAEFSTILDAIMSRRRIAMKYQTAARAASVFCRREIEPYALVNSGGDWYVLRKCCAAREIRTFSLARVYEPEIENRYFEMPEDFRVEEHLAGGFGRMRGEEPREIRLCISPPASAWIGGSRWHSTQKLKTLENGALQLFMRCPVTDSLVRWILQMGGSVKVEAPEELRILVVKNAQALLVANEGLSN